MDASLTEPQLVGVSNAIRLFIEQDIPMPSLLLDTSTVLRMQQLAGDQPHSQNSELAVVGNSLQLLQY